MATYVDPWIPVAPVLLDRLDDQQVSSLVSEVLAIYGDEDSVGARTSQRLGDLADAEVVELSGGHTIYNEKPEEFVDVVVGFLDVGSATSTNNYCFYSGSVSNSFYYPCYLILGFLNV
jgi:hypothetical protein